MAPEPLAGQDTGSRAGAWAAAALGFVGLLLIFHDTTRSLIDTWLNSETYTHGLLILPISLWLVWRKRAELSRLTPRPAPLVLVLLVGALAGWLLAHLVAVRVGEQLMLVTMLGLIVWAALGHRATYQVAFPLLFLFLAVPMGQDLVPPMMEFTATFTVAMLQLTGIPVYREGLYFVVPSGSWSVVEACSGVRYLIASVTLGFLYAYLTYRSLWRRAVFVALSVIVPIIANGLRAYIIVMIGHLSDMKLAVGVDHLIYGWLFFGIVMLLLFWIGSFWSEPEAHPADGSVGAAETHEPTPASRSWASAMVVVLALGIAWLGAWTADRMGSAGKALVAALEAPTGGDGWALARSREISWAPRIGASGERLAAAYGQGSQTVVAHVALFPAQRQDGEAVSSLNAPVDEVDTPWRIVARGEQVLDGTVSGLGRVRTFEIASGRVGEQTERMLVWQWYRLGAHATANAYVGKLLAAANLLYPGRTDGAYIAVGTPIVRDIAEAEAVLADFVADMLPQLDRAIDAAVIGPALR